MAPARVGDGTQRLSAPRRRVPAGGGATWPQNPPTAGLRLAASGAETARPEPHEEGEMEKEKAGSKANTKKQATLGIVMGAVVLVALSLVLVFSGEDNSPSSSDGAEV